eukprot:GILI01056745.1.p1 GENE.GILI01056745.1~~GILI01056745.1.p1  ORF type:complete len:310 (+),score=35.98 GILI01056745.1:90-932(+)
MLNASEATFSIGGNTVLVNSTRSATGIAMFASNSNIGPRLLVGKNSKFQINANKVSIDICNGDVMCGTVGGSTVRSSAFYFAMDMIAVAGSSVLTVSLNQFSTVNSQGYNNYPIYNGLRIVGALSAGPVTQGKRGFEVADNEYYGARGFNFTETSLFYIADNSIFTQGRFFYKELIAASLQLGALYASGGSHMFMIRNTLSARVSFSEGLPNNYEWLLGIGIHFPAPYFALGESLLSAASFLVATNIGSLQIFENSVSVDSLGDSTHGIFFGDPSSSSTS